MDTAAHRSESQSANFLRAALFHMFRLYDRRRQRLHLSELDEHLLADIGLTPADVRRECSQPFWR